MSSPAFAKYDQRFYDFGFRTAAQILGVPASQADDYQAYRKAYLKLVQKLHSDKNRGDSSHEAELRAINAAWNYVNRIETGRKVEIIEAKEAEQNRTQQPVSESVQNPSEELRTAAKAYAAGRNSRDAELMQVLNDNFRLGDVRPVIALIERRFKADVDKLLFVFTQNLYLGPASELLLKASIQYLFTKYPQFADAMVEIYYKQLEARLEIIEPSVSNSEEARRQGNQLLRLLYTLEQTRIESGRKPRKVRAGKSSCEENVANKAQR
jgi:hypothetical protein